MPDQFEPPTSKTVGELTSDTWGDHLVTPRVLVGRGVVAARNQRSRMVLEWLSDDGLRKDFFKQCNAGDGQVRIPSRDASPLADPSTGISKPLAVVAPSCVPVTLITERARIEEVLRNVEDSERVKLKKKPRDGQDPTGGEIVTRKYSSRVYAALAGGNFMLALDPWQSDTHDLQRQAFSKAFPCTRQLLTSLAHAACDAGAITGLQEADFDLAAFSMQVALRHCQMMMGYSVADYPQLEIGLGISYQALVHQVFGRHFVTDPCIIPEAQGAMGALLTRTSALIDAYARNDEDELHGCYDRALPSGITPVLRKLAELVSDLNGAQRAVVAVGAAIGTVGNVQAAVCIAVQAFFKCQEKYDAAVALANSERACDPTAKYDEWVALIDPALRANPPIPYLPRLEVDENGNTTGELLLALGGGTSAAGVLNDPLVWGLPGTSQHHCAGQALAWPLIIEIVRQVMALPGLAQGLDPLTARPKGLKKIRGFACDSYPLSYRIDRRRAQNSLNVTMRILPPVQDNVNILRALISAGAPRIERLLREARHIHFAWFEIIEQDSVLVLHTVYDGPFGAYLQHFALEAGDLFDLLFKYIVNPPPTPVAKYPNEFAAHLLAFDLPPAMGYFFSAYPRSEVARILRATGDDR